MQALRPQFTRHAMGQRAQRVFGAGKSAKAQKPTPLRTLAVAPVKIMVPCPRGRIKRTASRPTRKPAAAAASAAISHTLQ